MKKYKLIDELKLIKDETIEKILSIKTKEDLRSEKMKEKNHQTNSKFIWISALAACLCVVLVGLFTNNSLNKDSREKISNPLTEVKSIAEMKKYLGFDVPIIANKKVKSYIVIGDDHSNYAYHGRIIYEDESEFEIEKGNKDISGIYGAEKEKEQLINNINVTILTTNETRYAIWTSNGYSYSYSSNINDSNFMNNLTSIVSKTR